MLFFVHMLPLLRFGGNEKEYESFGRIWHYMQLTRENGHTSCSLKKKMRIKQVNASLCKVEITVNDKLIKKKLKLGYKNLLLIHQLKL